MSEENWRLDPDLIRDAYSFNEYVMMAEMLVIEGRTTGPDQSQKFIDFTKLNLHRIKRIYKKMKLDLETILVMEKVKCQMLWLVIGEVWCGDVAQNVPYMQALAEINPNIELKLILKNEHPEIMRRFLTNGAESIPKLICLEPRNYFIAGTWGPRPAGAQQLLIDYKKNPDRPKAEVLEDIQRWYAADKGRSIQAELRGKTGEWYIALNQKLSA